MLFPHRGHPDAGTNVEAPLCLLHTVTSFVGCTEPSPRVGEDTRGGGGGGLVRLFW